MVNQFRYFFVCVWILFAQITKAQQNFLQYALQDGLPQSQVYGITQGPDGYLWVGTQGGGIVRFDGQSFSSPPWTDHIPDKYINALVSDPKGQIWVGSRTGLSVLSQDSVHVIPWLLAQKVTTLSIDQQQTLWVGTERGLFYIQTNKQPYQIQKYQQLRNANIRSFFLTENELWAATNTGAWQLNGTKHYSIQNGLESNDVHAIYRDVLGRLWVATFNGRIVLFDTETNEVLGNIVIPNAAHPQFITTIDQNIWIGTINNGIANYNIDTKSWSNLDERSGLAAKNIKTLYRDSWNNLWLGTSGEGLLKSIGQEFAQYGLQSGLHGDNIYALFQDSQNRIWFSESGYGVSVLDNNGIHHYGQKEGFANIKCKAITEDQKGRIWIATDGRGLAYQDTSGFHFLSEKNGLPSNWINSLVVDTFNNIWAGTYGNGIAKIQDRDTFGFQIFPYGKPEGLPELKIQCLQLDPKKRLWFSTRNGYLAYYDHDFEPIILNSDNGLPKADIRSIAFSENKVWVGTAGKGIYFANWKKQPIRFIKADYSHSTTPVKMSNNIYLLKADAHHNLWVGTERGLNRLALNYNTQVVDFKHFGKEEGFLGIETCQNAITFDHNKNLWVGTMNGLMKYQTTQKSIAVQAPKIHFEEIQLFYKSLQNTAFKTWLTPTNSIKPNLLLPHDKNHLGFKLSGINLARPNQVKYRWQLAGSETNWSPLSTANNVNYANLSPGQYVFKAQACLTPDNCSIVITAPFGIQKPYWQTWWFRLAVVGGFLLVSFLIYRLRVNAIRKQESAKRKELELKNHLLTVEQKALQLQMNPHFIFNALNSINALVALKDFAQARKQINQFAILMRQILSNSRKDKITLEEEKKTLQNYLSMEQFCRPNLFEFNITIDESIDEEEIEVPPMIIQPFVENAIIHGVTHLGKKGIINVNFKTKNSILICEITDNGVGRKKSAELRKKRSPSHQSTAMAVTKERLDALFAERHGNSIEITDIVSDNNNISGTKVVLKIPIN